MFRGTNQQLEQEPDDTIQEQPKYPNPKILLIDMPGETEAVLQVEGYNVCTGSFGTPYRVEKSSRFYPVVSNGALPPNFVEQEIIVIDLEPVDVLDEMQGEKHFPLEENDWWASCVNGFIDPRPRLMLMSRDNLDRILSHGGVFIIFAQAPYPQEMKLGYTYGNNFIAEGELAYDNWSFLSILRGLEVRRDSGEEISVSDFAVKSLIGPCLSEYVNEAIFSCTLHPQGRVVRESWITLAANKYDDPVSGFLFLKEEESAKPGWVFVFPQIRGKSRFVARFLKEVLPDLAPHLFPHVEGARWVQRPEYELPRILELERQIQLIQEETRQQIASLKREIEEERSRMGYLHDTVRETGRSLVIAVKKTLELLGFQSVVDVDEEMKETEERGPKREDLQIRDISPVLLVEVKGISGIPRDADVLQVGKYIAPRMREWNRTDIRGLAIINHQRHLPALERDNESLFREDLIINAEEQEFGLLSTWDLFRLTRSYLKNTWNPEYVRPLFYQSGRIEPIPTHYQFLGIVERFWPEASAIGIRIEEVELGLGDRIAFELPVEFEEQVVESLQVDGEPVERADVGQFAGIKTHLTEEQVKKKGVRVFRVQD
jgi:hypothetical protein